MMSPPVTDCQPSRAGLRAYYSFFCISQNHRIVGVGRDLCGSSSPTPQPNQLSSRAEEMLTFLKGLMNNV